MAHSSAIGKRNRCEKDAALHKRRGGFFKANIQPKLTVNQPNDVYEQEADAMADKVMRAGDDPVAQNAFFGEIPSKTYVNLSSN